MAETAPNAILSARILWSSGTGNSRRAALWVAEELAQRGVRACVAGMEQPLEADDDGPDSKLLGLCFPTHGFTAPWSVLSFTWRLPSGKGLPAFVLATRAGGWYLVGYLPGFAGTAAWLPALLLWLKGYKVLGLTGLDMPSNWLLIHPGMNTRHQQFFQRLAESKCRRFSARILHGPRWIWTPWNLAELLLGIVCLPISIGYLLFGRFYLAKLFFANERCNGCAQCAENCPRQAIRMDGVPQRPYWTFNCESCMRCMAFCPQRAVESSQSLALLYTWCVLLLPTAWILKRTPEPYGGILADSFQWAAGLLLVWALYTTFTRLIRIRPILAIASRTTFTRWYRRHREAGTSLKVFRLKDPGNG